MAKFVLRKNTDDQFWFVLKCDNNKTVLQSQMYTTKQHAQDGISAIKIEAALATVADQTVTAHTSHLRLAVEKSPENS